MEILARFFFSSSFPPPWVILYYCYFSCVFCFRGDLFSFGATAIVRVYSWLWAQGNCIGSWGSSLVGHEQAKCHASSAIAPALIIKQDNYYL